MRVYRVLAFGLLCTCFLVACNRDSSKKDIKTFWKYFVKDVYKRNIEEIKSASLPKIHCKECLYNSKEELDQINNLRLKDPNQWDDNREGELSYIPIDTFLAKDIDLIFDNNLRARLKKKSNVSYVFREFERPERTNYLDLFIDDTESYKLHEIIVTIENASTQSPGEIKIFQVLETKQGLKFYGYIH